MGIVTNNWGPWKPNLPAMNTSDQSFIHCFQLPALERVRKQWRIQSNVICHPGKRLDEKSPIIGLLSRGKWKIIVGNNTKALRNWSALICESPAFEKSSGVKLLLCILLERSVCFKSAKGKLCYLDLCDCYIGWYSTLTNSSWVISWFPLSLSFPICKLETIVLDSQVLGRNK